MQDLLQDLRYGLRLLFRDWIFTAAAVCSLALGIGANTTIFSFFNAIFMHTLPVEQPSRLVRVYTADAKNTGRFLDYMQMSYPNYEDYRDTNQVFSGLVAQTFTQMSLSFGAEPEVVLASVVSGNYFEILGIKAAIGRSFGASEDAEEGKNPVVVLSDHLWKRRFGGDRSLVGKEIVLNRGSYTVIGVTPQGFRGTFAIGGPDLFVPLGMHEQVLSDFALTQLHHRRTLLLDVFGRLKPGMGLERARSEMQTIARRLEQSFPQDNEARTVSLVPLPDTLINPNVRGQVLLAGEMMMGVVGLVLLIACANVANLLLARASMRGREIAIRLSVGARRARLIRQLLTESILLSTLAGLLGLLLASWGRDLLWLMRPPQLDADAIRVSLDSRVLAFTATITLLTALLFGLVPALRASKVDLAWALKDRAGDPKRTNSRFQLRNMLVAFQVAMSIVALAGAGLFLRSLQEAQKIDPGFEKENLVMMSYDLAGQKYEEERGREFHLKVTERLQQISKVKGVGIASAPLFGGDIMRTVFAEGQDIKDRKNGRLTALLRVSPGYLEAIGVPLTRGRGFTERDGPNAPMVAVVNETMAKRLWPGEDPIGKRFRCYGEQWVIEVIGIARDAKYATLGEAPTSFMYFPLLQHYSPAVTLHVRTEGDPSSMISILRNQVQALDQSLPIIGVTTIGTVMQNLLWAPRAGAVLLAVFGSLALLLATIGIYGVMSYSVTQRTREIGIRMAMGASGRDVLRLVLGQAFLILLIGSLAGIAAAFAVSRLLSSLLYGVGMGDPLSFAGTTLVLVLVALLASYIPSRRAIRVEPAITLQYE
jgi:macrolide transport system ATP-binding/permease protein